MHPLLEKFTSKSHQLICHSINNNNNTITNKQGSPKKTRITRGIYNTDLDGILDDGASDSEEDNNDDEGIS
jgi:hypothetical protein